jgi:hypothetical protein
MLAEVGLGADLSCHFPQMSVFCTSAGPFKTGKGRLIQSRCQGLIAKRRPGAEKTGLRQPKQSILCENVCIG